MQKEQNRLDDISQTYSQFSKDQKVNYFRTQTIVSLCKGPHVLELGCADGLVTEQLVQYFEHVVAIDGSSNLIDKARKRAPRAEYVHALFEDYVPCIQFDTVILGHVLEHVMDSVFLIRRAKEWLHGDGFLIATVPNGESIHRRLGVELGMIGSPTQLNENDLREGHRRVYTLGTLKTDIEEAGLEVVHAEGIMFKPLSNRQMFNWSDDLLEACYKLAKKLPPEFGGELCLVCANRKQL